MTNKLDELKRQEVLVEVRREIISSTLFGGHRHSFDSTNIAITETGYIYI